MLGVLALLTACGHDISAFEGKWSVSSKMTTTCTGSAPTVQNMDYDINMVRSDDADIEYTSVAGCVFRFRIDEDRASLSNGPVVCETFSNGQISVFTTSKYTLEQRENGISISSSATLKQGATECGGVQSGIGLRI